MSAIVCGPIEWLAFTFVHCALPQRNSASFEDNFTFASHKNRETDHQTIWWCVKGPSELRPKIWKKPTMTKHTLVPCLFSQFLVGVQRARREIHVAAEKFPVDDVERIWFSVSLPVCAQRTGWNKIFNATRNMQLLQCPCSLSLWPHQNTNLTFHWAFLTGPIFFFLFRLRRRRSLFSYSCVKTSSVLSSYVVSNKRCSAENE